MADLHIYGICTNSDYKDGTPCPKCASKKNFSQKDIQKIRLRDDFVCKECGSPLTRVTLPKSFWEKYGKAILCVVVLVLIGFGIYRGCTKDPILHLNDPNNRTMKVGETDTLLAIINDGDSVVWSVAIGDSLVSVVAINDSKCVVKALKDGQQAVVIASLLDYPEVRDTCVYVVKPVEIVSPDTIVVKKDSIPDDTVKATKPVVDSHAEGKVIDKPQPPTIESKTATIDLDYAIYNGPYKVVNGKKVPHGLGGELKFKRSHEIDLKKASGEKVQVDSGDRMRNCKFDNGRLVQGLIIFSNVEQRWITIGS